MDPIAVHFDESTTALDSEMTMEVFDVMVQLAVDGMTTLCVAHEMGFAKQVADRVIFVDERRIIEDCSKHDFFNTPRAERAQSLLAKMLRH